MYKRQEQYRKSTDRNYTLAGFVMTVFMALTAFLATEKMTMVLITVTLPLWVGTGTALLILCLLYTSRCV